MNTLSGYDYTKKSEASNDAKKSIPLALSLKTNTKLSNNLRKSSNKMDNDVASNNMISESDAFDFPR